MSVSGKNTIVAIQPTSTWNSAATIGATDGILPDSIDRITQSGEIVFDESVGMSTLTDYDFISETADPTIVLPMRWNGAFWSFLAHLLGDDTVTGAGTVKTHTMNWQAESTLVGITMGVEVNNASIFEIPSLKVQSISLDPSDGFWNMTVTTLGSRVLTGANATADSTAFDNVTYSTTGQRMRFRGNRFRMNSQSGGALGSGDVENDLFNMSITLSRNYDPMDDVLMGVTTGNERGRAEPIQDGHVEMLISFDNKTADFATHIDDLNSANEYKADLNMTETIGADVHDANWEFGRMIPIDPQAALEKGQRIPMSHNYRLIDPSGTPTGMSTSNEIHFVLQNLATASYE